MRKLEIADAEMMRIAVQQEIRRSEDSRYDYRLHGVLLVSQGLSCGTVADYLGEHRVTVERWVTGFNHSGFAALREGERSGRPTRLAEADWKRVDRDLRKPPRKLGYGQNLWDGKLLSHHLAVRYGVQLAVRQCQRIFRHLGFRRRKPRPVIAEADPAAQAAYKKTPTAGPQRKH
jgi:transposase